MCKEVLEDMHYFHFALGKFCNKVMNFSVKKPISFILEEFSRLLLEILPTGNVGGIFLGSVTELPSLISQCEKLECPSCKDLHFLFFLQLSFNQYVPDVSESRIVAD